MDPDEVKRELQDVLDRKELEEHPDIILHTTGGETAAASLPGAETEANDTEDDEDEAGYIGDD